MTPVGGGLSITRRWRQVFFVHFIIMTKKKKRDEYGPGEMCDVFGAKIEDKSMQKFSVNLLRFCRVNGNHARVKWHGVSGSPPDETATLPFFGLVGQNVLSCVVDVVAIVAGLASVQLNHIFADDLVGGKAQQTLHSRVDVTNVEVAVRHCHQFYRERSNN
jgi:hypothetical protein